MENLENKLPAKEEPQPSARKNILVEYFPVSTLREIRNAIPELDNMAHGSYLSIAHKYLAIAIRVPLQTEIPKIKHIFDPNELKDLLPHAVASTLTLESLDNNDESTKRFVAVFKLPLLDQENLQWLAYQISKRLTYERMTVLVK